MGLWRQNKFDLYMSKKQLIVMSVNKTQVYQVVPGGYLLFYIILMYQYKHEDNTVLKIQKINIGNTVFALKTLGINNLMHLDFLDPLVEMLISKLKQLDMLNYLGKLTKIVKFSLDVTMTTILLASERYFCLLANVVHGPTSNAIRKNFYVSDGNHPTESDCFTNLYFPLSSLCVR